MQLLSAVAWYGLCTCNAPSLSASFSALLVTVGEDPTTWLPGALLAEALPVVIDVAGARGISFSGNLSVRHGAANLEAFCVDRNGV